MKTLSIISLIILLVSCNQKELKDKSAGTEMKVEHREIVLDLSIDTVFTFEKYEDGKKPTDWSQYFTGKSGENPNWKILIVDDNKVLAQLSEDNPNYHFNEIVSDGFAIKNVEMKVRMKGVKGKMDRGGGFIWRFIDADNYYVVRANPLEDNVVLYRVKDGKRKDLPLIDKGRTYGVDVEPLGDGWNNLGLKVVDDMFTVYLNNKQILQVRDSTFTNAGKIGLWTKADAVSYFDDFQVKCIK
ncbi:MAG: hypothetical protein U9R19_03175 [Bacteroidota bacterium]|nr:hypothetical protein [Bacteroidota bacterium]